MPRYPTDQRNAILAETRQRFLAAAEEEFAAQGFENANIERISAAAGFAKGTIYNHFPSKRALMETLLDEIAARHCEFIITRVRAETDPGQRLRSFYLAGFAYVTGHLASARIAMAILNSPDHLFNQRLYDAYQPLFTLLAREVLLPGAKQGVFSDRLPFSTVSLLMSLYIGAVASIAPDNRPYQDPAQVADFALAALRG